MKSIRTNCCSCTMRIRNTFPRFMPLEFPAAERAPCSIIARTSRPCWPSAALGTKRVIGVSFDGTGYGDDGTIWGGEIFAGSVREGFERVAHLRSAALPGGDAAATYPVQAAAGFLAQLNELPDLATRPFSFPLRYRDALQLVSTNVRSFGHHVRGTPLRYRSSVARFHARSNFRRPGRDVAGAPCRPRARCRCLSVPIDPAMNSIFVRCFKV